MRNGRKVDEYGGGGSVYCVCVGLAVGCKQDNVAQHVQDEAGRCHRPMSDDVWRLSQPP